MMSPISDRDNQKCQNCGNELIRGIDYPAVVWAPTAGKGMLNGS
jgi:hypothetical protein